MRGAGFLIASFLCLLLFIVVSSSFTVAITGPCNYDLCYNDNWCGRIHGYWDTTVYPMKYVRELVQSNEQCSSGYNCTGGSCVSNMAGCNPKNGDIICSGTGTCIKPVAYGESPVRRDCTINEQLMSVPVDPLKPYYYFDKLIINSNKKLLFINKPLDKGTCLSDGNCDDKGLGGDPGIPFGGAGGGGSGGNGGYSGERGGDPGTGGHSAGGAPGGAGGVVFLDANKITVNGVLSVEGQKGDDGYTAGGFDCGGFDCVGRGAGGGGGGGGGGQLSLSSPALIDGSGYILAIGGKGGFGGNSTEEKGRMCYSNGDDWGAAGGGGGGGNGGVIRKNTNTVISSTVHLNCSGGIGGLGGCYAQQSSYTGGHGLTGYGGNCYKNYADPEICDNNLDDDNDGETDYDDSDCQYCGNGIVESQKGEECDTTDPNCYYCKWNCAHYNSTTYKNTGYTVIPNNKGCFYRTCQGSVAVLAVITNNRTNNPLCDGYNNSNCYCEGSCVANVVERRCGTRDNFYCSKTGECDQGIIFEECTNQFSANARPLDDPLINYLITHKDDSLLGGFPSIKDFSNPITQFAGLSCDCDGNTPVCDPLNPDLQVVYNDCADNDYCFCATDCVTPKYFDYCGSSYTKPICSGICMPSPTVGVLLNKTYNLTAVGLYGGGEYYTCGVSDGVCPDDFAETNTEKCGNVNGVCSSHGISDPDCTGANYCGNGVLDAGEQCDGNSYNASYNACSDFGYSSGTVSCSADCKTTTTNCAYSITDVAYNPQSSGCNPYTKICGRDGQLQVAVSVNALDNIPVNSKVDLTLKNDEQSPCMIFSLDYVLSNPGSGVIVYTGIVNKSYFEQSDCLGKTVNHTVLSYIRNGSGTARSNVFDGYDAGFKLSECGDGQIDDLRPFGNSYFESCDYNLSSQQWMTSSCALINVTHPNGTAFCNQVSCKWNMSTCYKCGDGIKQSGEECDDGNFIGTDFCSNSCKLTTCGDSITQGLSTSGVPNGAFYLGHNLSYQGYYFKGWEDCDDNNFVQNDRCFSNCTKTVCGDGVLNNNPFNYDYQVEACDDGNNVSTDLCNNCVKTFCGDGVVQWPNGLRQNGTSVWVLEEPPDIGYYEWGYESCDDGNSWSFDKCYSNCTKTFCGDGIRQSPNGVGTGGRLNNGFEDCDDKNFNENDGCTSACVSSFCGNGLLDTGEECDDGGRCSSDLLTYCTSDVSCSERGLGVCILMDGDGCSSSCTLTNCNITSLTVNCPSGVCGKGDNITVSAQYSGSSCSLATVIQVDYDNKLGNQYDCMIQSSPLIGQLQGMNSSFNITSNPKVFKYNVPLITELCAGKTLNYGVAALYSANGYLRSNGYYSFNVNSTILNDCKQFGVVSAYTNYNVSLGFSVIANSTTSCFTHTCNSYVANPVNFIVNPFGGSSNSYGVELMNSVGNYTQYFCDVLNEDFVCPDDFSYNNACRQNTLNNNGICKSHNVSDADCELKTPMICGRTRIANGSDVYSCNVPVPVPYKYCTNSSMCVYANEATGENASCNLYGGLVTNALGHSITCSNNNTWCPEGYKLNNLGRCVDLIPVECTTNCPLAINVSMIQSINKKGNIFWESYLNSSNCFMIDSATNRREYYCGVQSIWPEIRYHFLPINVTYYYWDPGIGGFQKVE